MIEAVISDIHFPDVDQAAWELTLKILNKIKPDLVVLLGDILDEDPVSRYATKVEFIDSLQWELDTTFTELSRLRNILPSARMIFQPGNHDVRLEHYISGKAKELSSLRVLSLPSLMKLDDLSIEFIEEDTKWHVGRLWHTHGHLIKSCGSINAARNLYVNTGCSMIIGHYHRANIYTHTRYSGESDIAIINSTLQNFDVQFVHHHSWSSGITMIDYTRSGYFKPESMVYFRENGNIYYVLDGELMTEELRGSEKKPGNKQIVSIEIGEGSRVEKKKASQPRDRFGRFQPTAPESYPGPSQWIAAI